MSGIHAGIQAGHAAVELMQKYYCKDSLEGEIKKIMVLDWAQTHKTFIVLNGGMSPAIHEMKAHLEKFENPYPWSFFIEPDADNLLSSLVVILPEEMYGDEANAYSREFSKGEFTFAGMNFSDWEKKFLQLKSKARFAS
jgi:hypothetical protein